MLFMVCKNFKVCIIGSGSIGRRHAEILTDLNINQIVFHSEKNIDGPVKIGNKSFPMISDFSAAIADTDAVFIANPSSMHTSYLLRLIELEKHVYIEKPVGVNKIDIDILRTIERKSRSKIQVGSQFRFNEHLCSIKSKLRENLFGTIYSVSAYSGEHIKDYPYPNYKHSYAVDPALGGGVILTQIHQIDYLNWLFGPIVSVFAVANSTNILNLEVETCISYILVCESGLNITCNLNFLRRPKLQTIEIGGSACNISWSYETNELVFESSVKNHPHYHKEKNPFDRNAMFRGAIINFLDAINKNTALVSPLADGIRALEIACAVKESVRARKIINIGG